MTNHPSSDPDNVPLTKGCQGWTFGKPDGVTYVLLAILICVSICFATLLG
jgi:hypothetical protein